MTYAPSLTSDLVERLKDAWRRQRVPLLAHLRPGLSDRDIDALVEPLGLHVPPELRLWWRTHDGVRDHRGEMLGRGWRYLPLEAAVAETHLQRGEYGAEPTLGPAYWHDEWLVWSLSSTGVLVGDCSDPTAHVTPVIYQDLKGDAQPDPQPSAPSVGTAVHWWIDALESGAAAYDAVSRRWNYDDRLLDAERESTRVV